MENENIKSNPALLEFTDTELLNELSTRFDSFICAGRKILDNDDNPKVERRRMWKGDYDVCIGLLHGAALDCLCKNWGIKGSDIEDD